MALVPGNPVVGGTVLRRASIESPNFVHGATGWSINQDGSAEFNSLTVRNGTIISGQFFLYSTATPALGKLVLSISMAAGTDSVGNAYLAGSVTYTQISGTFYASQVQGGAVNYYHATSEAGPWTPDGGLESGQIFAQPGAIAVVQSLLTFIEASTQDIIRASLATDTHNEFVIDSSGKHSWGSGSAAADAFMERSAANQLAASPVAALISGTPETWHTVGAAGQPAFVNSFTAGGTAPRFQQEPIGGGRVRLSGAANTGAITAANTTIFTLPAGYVPSRQFGFVTVNNVTAYTLGEASIQVTTGGAVQLVPAGTAGKFVLLDGICFELD